MSNWTHVASIIRADAFRTKASDTIDLDFYVGKRLTGWEEHDEWVYAHEHKEEYMPFGSEGSLNRSMWTNKVNYTAAYDIMVFGDLRDHDDVNEVIEWFKGVCKKVDRHLLGVRQAVITVDNEWFGSKVWAFDPLDAEVKEWQEQMQAELEKEWEEQEKENG